MAEIGSGDPNDPVFQQALGHKPVKPPKPKAKRKAKPKRK